jgi:hypothetical protein
VDIRRAAHIRVVLVAGNRFGEHRQAVIGGRGLRLPALSTADAISSRQSSDRLFCAVKLFGEALVCSANNRAASVSAVPLSSDHALALAAAMEYS